MEFSYRIKQILALSLLAAICFISSPNLTSAEDSATQIKHVGMKVDNFTLKDYRGKEHSLSDYQSSKLVVVAYLGTQCPLAKLYGARLSQLDKKYQSQNVKFLGVISNQQDSITEIASYARIHKVKFPILKDAGNHVADQMKAVRTPEVFVLDENRVVQYWGRIDDQYGVGYIRDDAQENFLDDAIAHILKGEKIKLAENLSVGCHIGRIRKPNENSKVTYSNQISRIFQKRCVECHRDGDIAPFTLTSYEDVLGWGDMIAEVVENNRMPPWHANPKHGDFVNDRHMSDDEKKLVYEWVKNGSPKGNPDDLPEPVKFVKGWQLSKEPDLVLNMSEKPFTVKAEGELKYQYFTVKTGFKEGRWVKSVEALPGNHAVVHHILVFIKNKGAKGRGIGGNLNYMAAYVPGFRVKKLPEGMARYIPAGAELVFQVHYTPIGTEQQDLSKVGMIFEDPENVTHSVQSLSAIEFRLNILPHASDHKVDAVPVSYDQDLILLSMNPHMHLRGKSFTYQALYPDGKKETLLDIPAYDFNWQSTYRLREPKLIPKGTKIICNASYDNSEDNLANPDPTINVHWGDQTWEEMMIGFFEAAIPVTDTNKYQRPVRPDSSTAARLLLKRFDKNRNSIIDKNEVPKRGKVFFLFLDFNKDGELTEDEIRKGIDLRKKMKFGKGSKT